MESDGKCEVESMDLEGLFHSLPFGLQKMNRPTASKTVALTLSRPLPRSKSKKSEPR